MNEHIATGAAILMTSLTAGVFLARWYVRPTTARRRHRAPGRIPW
ncbi:hypothetical protein [Streptomyces sp. NPDC093676]